MNQEEVPSLLRNQDFLLELSSRLDNSTLEVLSHTSLWNSIRLFARDQHFWYLRTQTLLGRYLKTREGDWKTDYYLLHDVLALNNETIFTDEVLRSKLAVQVMLEVGYDPTVDGNYAIQSASDQGYADVVELLLEDRRVDPSTNDNYAVLNASGRGHIDVVELLLEDRRVDPSADDNYAIRGASSSGHTGIIRLLLEDPRVDPTADDNYAIGMAAQYGHTEVVRLLLEDGRADPTADRNYAIRQAYILRHDDVVNLLLEDGRAKLDPNLQQVRIISRSPSASPPRRRRARR